MTTTGVSPTVSRMSMRPKSSVAVGVAGRDEDEEKAVVAEEADEVGEGEGG